MERRSFLQCLAVVFGSPVPSPEMRKPAYWMTVDLKASAPFTVEGGGNAAPLHFPACGRSRITIPIWTPLPVKQKGGFAAYSALTFGNAAQLKIWEVTPTDHLGKPLWHTQLS